jgi:hypothetical protein
MNRETTVFSYGYSGGGERGEGRGGVEAVPGVHVWGVRGVCGSGACGRLQEILEQGVTTVLVAKGEEVKGGLEADVTCYITAILLLENLW